jgi:5-methylcytosine-specific restriction endonuclease McrA
LCATHHQRARKVGTFDQPWTRWREERNCAWCGDTFKSPAHRDTRCCSFACSTKLWKRANPDSVRAHGQDAKFKRRARLRQAPYESFTIADVRARYGDDCYLCGEPIDFRLKWPHPLSPSLDHVVPLARGGKHTLDNVAMTNLACNLRKHVRPAASPPMPTLLIIR